MGTKINISILFVWIDLYKSYTYHLSILEFYHLIYNINVFFFIIELKPGNYGHKCFKLIYQCIY